MRLLCLTQNLKNTVSSAERIAIRSQNYPLLSTVKISTHEGKVKFSATNLEIGLELFTTCKIEESGEAVVPAKLLSSLLQTISDQKIEVYTKQQNLIIKTQSGESMIKGINAEEFPIIPKTENKYSINVSRESFQNALSSVLPAVALSDVKPELASIFIHFSNKKINFVATDSFRLAEKKYTLKKESDISEQAILMPYKTAQEIVRLASDDEQLEISFNKNNIAFTTNDFSLISRLTDGVFPNYATIIPKDFLTKVRVDIKALLDAIRSTSVFVGRLLDVSLDVRDNQIHVSTSNPDVGENKVVLDANIQGDSVQTTFNYKYIVDGLNQLHGKSAFIGFNGSQAPLFMRDDEDESYLYLVMPMRGL